MPTRIRFVLLMLTATLAPEWSPWAGLLVPIAHASEGTTAGVGQSTPDSDDTRQPAVFWGQERDNLQAGAYLLSSTGRLQPGDPIVIQFLLKNTAAREQTVVLQSGSETHPVLGDGNRIELNVIGNSHDSKQYVLQPDQILEERDHRVTVSSAGLSPGLYKVTTTVAFWISIAGNPDTAGGLAHGMPIPVPIGEESASLKHPESGVQEAGSDMHWGDAVGGLCVGLRLKGNSQVLGNETLLEGDLLIRNVSPDPVVLEYKLPGPADWNMSVASSNGQHVPLDSAWSTGLRARVTRRLTLAPNEVAVLTAPEQAEPGISERVGGMPSLKDSRPAIRVLRAPTEFQEGDVPRLIASQGNFVWSVYVSIRKQGIRDLDLVIGTSEIPFSVAAK